jgi:hypothetical protein
MLFVLSIGGATTPPTDDPFRQNLAIIYAQLAFLASAWVVLYPRARKDPVNRAVALNILSGFLGAFVFFAIDAGLKLLMG